VTTAPTQQQQQREVSQRQPDHPQQADQDQNDAHRRAEIWLSHHERAEDDEDRYQRQDDLPGSGQRAEVLLAGEQIRRPDENGELAELGRLELQRTEVEPAPGSVRHHADARNEHREQQHGCDDQHGIGEDAISTRWQPDRDPEHRHAKDDEHDLFDQLAPHGGIVGMRRRDRGRRRHEHAEPEQTAAGEQQQL